VTRGGLPGGRPPGLAERLSCQDACGIGLPRLEPLLPQVRKPIQYVGGELNSVVRDWDAAEVRWGADVTRTPTRSALPNQGVQILYEVLNECDGVLAERTYSVWPDLEELIAPSTGSPSSR